MATSGTTTYTMTSLEVIEKAFHRLGKASEGESLSARMASDGRSSLNLLLKEMQAEEHLWTKTEGTLALVAAQAGYTLSTITPLRILSIRRRGDDIDTPMTELSRQEYFDLPNKTDPDGIPISYYFDPQRANGVLYVWPSPDTNAVADFSPLRITYLRRIEDITASNENLDIPQEWLQAIIWMLADDLETEYPVNDNRLALKIQAKAAEGRFRLNSWDTESTSIFMQPDLG